MNEIKLPPLPERSKFTSLWEYTDGQMENYARAAVELDRLSREDLLMDDRDALRAEIVALKGTIADIKPLPDMRKHVEDFATKGGWDKDSGEGAFEFVQRISYETGWNDARTRDKPDSDVAKGDIVGWLRRRSDPDGACTIPGKLAGEIADHIEALAAQAFEGWKEATIAWSVCKSLHEKFCKGKDALYSTRHADFQKHEEAAREAANVLSKK